MDRDDGILIVGIIIVLAAFAWGGFIFGRKYQDKYWEGLIPEQMSKLCRECIEAGGQQ